MYPANSSEPIPKDLDLVRHEYKRYKRKKPPPDFADVIDFDRLPLQDGAATQFTDVKCCGKENSVGLKCAKSWKAYRVTQCPGLLFLCNPFQRSGQHLWMHRSLEAYTHWPYPSNIDIHVERDKEQSIWSTSKRERQEGFKETDTSLGKLRWVHLGYHFDYNVVDYKSEKYYGFPDELTDLMTCLSKCLGFSSYKPETAIINYYPIGSSMGGHTDHYEEELDQPLISISLGQPAVFLIGSESRRTKPVALWLRSGDVIVMAGKSRLAYHAVPAIVKLDKSTFFAGSMDDEDYCDSEVCHGEQGTSVINGGKGSYVDDILKNISKDVTVRQLFHDYMSNTRININVRQVHKTASDV